MTTSSAIATLAVPTTTILSLPPTNPNHERPPPSVPSTNNKQEQQKRPKIYNAKIPTRTYTKKRRTMMNMKMCTNRAVTRMRITWRRWPRETTWAWRPLRRNNRNNRKNQPASPPSTWTMDPTLLPKSNPTIPSKTTIPPELPSRWTRARTRCTTPSRPSGPPSPSTSSPINTWGITARDFRTRSLWWWEARPTEVERTR
mmetsp:Transcript_6040/g.11018  ORF Transcript_6040/g.11018 Transcript_6040/m.11018 type:complete len:200 (-) Transcript_6040:1467-2066(-)